MKKLICISCMIVLCIGILAGCKQDTTEETIVTLVWNGNRTEVKTSQWKDRSAEISTEDVSLGNGKIYDFVGVRLSDLMDIAGAEDCTKAIVKASYTTGNTRFVVIEMITIETGNAIPCG